MAGCLDEDAVKSYLEAGRIAKRVREEVAKLVEPGARVIDVCERAERLARELGGAPAFPCNIGINHVAAHYTPPPGDDTVIPEDAVVKIDVGVHVDGYIADTAVTVDLSDRYAKLLEASREALEKAIHAIRPGASLTEIGRVIEEVIRGFGFKPIRNLSGHSLDRYVVHAGDVIPNVGDRVVRGRVKPCTAYAIEPFATDGEGLVIEGDVVTIYAYTGRPVRARLLPQEKRLLAAIASRFRTLPFTTRWLTDVADAKTLDALVKRLAARGVLISYPVLIERGHGVVAQFEHTVLVLKDDVLVIT